jgi:DNA mismatch endonuclease (patch repair protein)
MDNLSKQERSERMSRIKGTDTGPEMIVRRLVHGMGFRYRLHARELPGKPDVVLPRLGKIIFVHGCFWHQHPGCGRQPKSRVEFWTKKLSQNRKRKGAIKMTEHYNVTLSWGSVEQGNYSDVVIAEGEDAARRALAEQMADHPDAQGFDSNNERDEWIKDRINGFNDVYPVSAQLTQDLATLFHQELFDGGHVRQINLVALAQVLAENRERILATV